jgi:predicted metal-dependent hydrolase
MGMLIELGDIRIDVVRKGIRNIHLSVHPPDGTVRISAPLRMDLNTIRAFAASKIAWIGRQQGRIREAAREPRREYVGRESHYVWGTRHLLKVIEYEGAPKVELRHDGLVLQIRPGTDAARRRDLVDQWYRALVKEAVPPLLERWEPRIGVKVQRFRVQRMKTKWGSCNRRIAGIRLNTELAKKPRECLEYVVVHELVHLLESKHGPRFVSLMDRFLPQWREHRGLLKR